MKIENFEYFVKRVARKLNTNIDVISLCKKYVWFDNGYFMALDNDGYLYFKGDNAGIIALSGMIQDYATQKDFFHALDIVIATENTETEETEETETTEANKPGMFRTSEEIRTAFINDGWGKGIKFVELTMEEAEQRGLHFATSGIKSGKKYFKMLPSGNIFDSSGEVAYLNIIGR